MVDLFTTNRSNNLPVCVSSVPDSITWKEDTFLQVYTFPPLHSGVLGRHLNEVLL